MTEIKDAQKRPSTGKRATSRRKLRKRLLLASLLTAVAALVVLAVTGWIAAKVTTVKTELQSATGLLPTLKAELSTDDPSAASSTVQSLAQHTSTAREATEDPIWKAASILPWIGPNLQAAGEIATAADDVARLGAVPLVQAFQSLNWQSLMPTSDGLDLSPLRKAAPQVQSAAYAVRESSNRLNSIQAGDLVPQLSAPLLDARGELNTLSRELDSAADAARLAPAMLGDDGPRRYLLLVQNNAESRATGGIPGALAVLSFSEGRLKLESQTSASALGTTNPPISIGAEQQAIYSARVGKFMQDVNLTPDFPTSASTAKAMWESKTGQQLDGVVSLDPVALSFLLDATGPVKINDPLVKSIGEGLPAELSSKNVVQTLLSDVYAAIKEPARQDVYFASAAQEIFSAVSAGKSDPKRLVDSISKGVAERRILLWSAKTTEQGTIAKYSIGGQVSGSSVSPAQFGVYFNDGTGAKMDFWIKRTVQIVRDCTRDGYREVAIRVTSTNSAPLDAATSLPTYVTGAGIYGVPAGSVQTNIVAYGPVQSNIDTVIKDGAKVPFAAQRHNQRAVGTSTVRLAPGESTTLEFNFGHIVQDAQPEIVVTPTTEPVKDVIHPASMSQCE